MTSASPLGALAAILFVGCNQATKEQSASLTTATVQVAPSSPPRTSPPPPPPTSKILGEEPSRYGQFRRTYRRDDACVISVSLASGKPIDLFGISGCTEGGLADVTPVRRVGDLEFPILASDGQEFHLFSIPTARGGNAVASNDYWIAVLTRESAWGAFITSASPLRAEFKDPVLILEQPSTTTSEGERVSISARRIEPTPLPRSLPLRAPRASHS